MAVPTRWRIAGATAVATGLTLGGLMGLAHGDDRPSTEPITLRDEQPANVVDDPAPVEPIDTWFDIDSPESVDSPLESVVDSPASVNSPVSA